MFFEVMVDDHRTMKPTRDTQQLRSVIGTDLYRYDGSTGLRGLLRTYLSEPGFRFTFWMRVAAHLTNASPWLKVLGYAARYQCHGALQNQPGMGASKPASNLNSLYTS
jgi:hypothetical protein